MSEKSSTFATEFERKGTIKTTPDSLICVRDYREFRCKSTTFFELCKYFDKKNTFFMKYTEAERMGRYLVYHQ